MNPIPLSMPNGEVLAYACGCCFQVTWCNHPLCALDTPELRAEYAEHHRRDVESCCMCHYCGVPTPRGTSFPSFCCDGCIQYLGFLMSFERLGECIEHGITDQEGWWQLLRDRCAEDD